jgi:hypothetical protein
MLSTIVRIVEISVLCIMQRVVGIVIMHHHLVQIIHITFVLQRELVIQ